jgi:hypothetical protein
MSPRNTLNTRNGWESGLKREGEFKRKGREEREEREERDAKREGDRFVVLCVYIVFAWLFDSISRETGEWRTEWVRRES